MKEVNRVLLKIEGCFFFVFFVFSSYVGGIGS